MIILSSYYLLLCIQKGDLQGQLDRLQHDKEAIEKRLQEESSRHEKVIDKFCVNHIRIHCI